MLHNKVQEFYAFPIILNMSSANRILLNSTELSCDFLFSICLLFSLCSLLLSSLLSSSLWLDRSANFCLMLLTFFLDSLSNPLIIVTICVPKRRMKMICIDCQVFMFCASKVDGVENEESMWKHSPKNWGMKTLLSSVR